jgi:hypothetical protein
LVRDGSQGIKHKLFPEFVKEICTMSNSWIHFFYIYVY